MHVFACSREGMEGRPSRGRMEGMADMHLCMQACVVPGMVWVLLHDHMDVSEGHTMCLGHVDEYHAHGCGGVMQVISMHMLWAWYACCIVCAWMCACGWAVGKCGYGRVWNVCNACRICGEVVWA